MTHRLYPPLAFLENELFGHQPTTTATEAVMAEPADNPGIAEVAPEILTLIRRKSSFRAESGPPAVGQIRSLADGPAKKALGRPLERNLGVLLSACLGGNLWSGWIVCPETDYATDRDLIIEESDGPCAPEVAMIQTWNQVTLPICGSEPILGHISSARLGAVLTLAEHASPPDQFVPPRPGKLGVWDLDPGQTVMTGTPLGDEVDPRRAYQELYRRLATEFSKVREVQPVIDQPGGSVREWLHRTFVRPAWTFGAMAAALVLAQIVLFSGNETDAIREAGVYRSGPPSSVDDCSSGPRLRVLFRPDAPLSEVLMLLRGLELIVVAGPAENGQFWVKVPEGRSAEEALRLLSASSLVDEALLVSNSANGCGK
mgnify:CR=1 FL=1